MNVGKVACVNNNYSNVLPLKGNSKSNEYENPVSRSTERNLSILSTFCGASVVGLVVGGLATFLKHPEMTEKSFKGFTTAYKMPILAGLAAMATTLVITLPAKIYNTNVNAFVKQKEMDVFSRDRNLKTNLTEEVDNEVQDDKVSLDKKLDDNLKLQMANRGSAIGIANVTSQPQG